jgi:diazepam-binding inhibitor (GABA receptor modulating acyl-CoA-binding protein)
MADLASQFSAAAQAVQQLPQRPDNDTLLKLYALYKQATVGNVSGSRPGFTDFAGRAKYDAWTKLKGTAKETAMQDYINLVERLK